MHALRMLENITSSVKTKYEVKTVDTHNNTAGCDLLPVGVSCLCGVLFGRRDVRVAGRGKERLMTATDKTGICLRAGWMFHLKSVFGTTWQKKWVTMDGDGVMTITRKPTGRRRNRGSLTFDIKRDCMYVWTSTQCQPVILPKECDSTALIEMLLTGGRKLALCGLSKDDAELWYRSIECGRSERDLPTPRYSSMLEEVPEQPRFWCCACLKASSKVKAIDYRPTTRHSQISSQSKLRRRVSWSKRITVIPEVT